MYTIDFCCEFNIKSMSICGSLKVPGATLHSPTNKSTPCTGFGSLKPLIPIC